MHSLISSHDIVAFHSFISNNKSYNFNHQESLNNDTPLHIACFTQQYEICKILIKNKADPSIINNKGNTPLHSLVLSQEQNNKLSEQSKIIKILCKTKSTINIKNNDGKTPIHLASSKGYTDILLILSNQKECDLNIQDNNGFTPIVLAARNNRKDTVQVLLGLHVSKELIEKEAASGKLPEDIVYLIDKRKISEIFATTIAQYNGKLASIFQTLLTKNTQETLRILKKDKSLLKRKGPFNSSLLHIAAFFGVTDVMPYIVEKNKTLLSSEDEKRKTPLHIAAQELRLKTCECLLKLKADPCVTDINGRTPLHYLAKNTCSDPVGYHKVFKLLLENGAILDARDLNGDTPLHIASEYGVEQAIVYLKPLGANINAKNEFGKLPIQVAARYNNAEIVGIMMGLGADISNLKKDYLLGLLPHDVNERFALKLKDSTKSSYVKLSNNSTRRKRSQQSLASINIGGEEHKLLLIDQINQIISSGGDLSKFIKPQYITFIQKHGSTGQAPIHMAAMEGNSDAVQLLLTKYNCDPNLEDSIGRTPLLLACKFGRLNVIECLKNDYMLNARCGTKKNNKTALHYLASFPMADINRVSQVIKKLIDRGLDINTKTKKQGYLPIHYAVLSGNSNTILILNFFNSNITEKALNGKSAIQLAADNNKLDILKTLIEIGGNINNDLYYGIKNNIYSSEIQDIVSNTQMKTPRTQRNLSLNVESQVGLDMYLPQQHSIHKFISDNPSEQEINKMLRKQGNISALHIPDINGDAPIHIATKQENIDLVCILANKYSVSINRLNSEGNNCLHIVACLGNIKYCESLLECKANPLILDSEGNSIFHLLATNSSLSNLSKSFFDSIINYNLSVDLLNNQGKAALHIAATTGSNALISSLLEKKANIDILCSENHTPLYYALKNEKKSTIRSLKVSNASISWLNSSNENEFKPVMLDILKILDSGKGSNMTVSRNDTDTDDPVQLFHSLTITGNKQELRKMIKKNPKLISSLDHEGSSVLHMAAYMQNQDLMVFFLDKKLDPNIVNSKGYAPLLIAAKAGNLSICELLLENGTDARVSTRCGFSGLHFLAAKKFDIKEEKLVQRVIKLFSDQGASINQKNCNLDSPIHIACNTGNDCVVSCLLNLRVNCEGINLVGNSPIIEAINGNHSNIIKLLLDYSVSVSLCERQSIQLSFPILSKETIKILENHKITIPQQLGKRDRADKILKKLQSSIDIAFLENSTRDKVEKRKSNNYDTNSLPKDLNLVSPQHLTTELLSVYKQVFRTCATSSPNSKVRRIDSEGIQKLLDILQVSPLSVNFSMILQQKSTSGFITFQEFIDIFGSALMLFGKHSLGEIHNKPKPATLSKTLSPRGKTLPPPRKSKRNTTEGRVVISQSKKPSPPLVPPSDPSPIKDYHTVPPLQRTSSISQSSELLASILLKNVSKAHEQNASVRSKTPPVVPPRPKSLNSHEKMQPLLIRSSSICGDKSNELSKTKSLITSNSADSISDIFNTQIINEVENKNIIEFADSMTTVDEILPNSSSYLFFGSLYDKLLLKEGETLLSIDIFEEYFKDSFTSYNLLHTIVPTLMAQKDLEVQGITREAFCDFFMGLKTKSLPRTLEVTNRLKIQLSLCLNETLQGYNNYSSVDRFKARTYLQQLSKLFGLMEETIRNTYNSFLTTKVHELTQLNDYDICIQELQNNMLELHDVLNKLYAPRKIDECSFDDKSELSPRITKDYSPARNVILIVRKIQVSSDIISFRTLLDTYIVRCSLYDECINSFIKFSEPSTFKVYQTWKSASKLEEFLNSNTHKEFLSSTESLKTSEDVTVTKIS